MSEIERMNMDSENLVDERINRMRELFPEVFSEGGIDFEKLRLELGDEVDDGDERYSFTWPGKRDAIRQSQTVSTATLRPCVEKSRGRYGEDGSFDSDNLYIEGDNLEVLKLLQRAYHSKVKMIYIDPPYNTGHDFVYKDSFGDSIENYREQAGISGQSNADTSGRFHSNWCTMMYPRLKLAWELLREDGVIFISIDDNEFVNLRNIMNEIFGETNHLVEFVWSSKGSGAYDAKQFKTEHEYVLAFAKNSERFTSLRVPYNTSTDSAYNQIDDRFEIAGKYKRQALAMGTLSYSESLDYPVLCPDGSSIYPGGHFGPPYAWRYSKEKMEKALAEGFAEIVKTKNGWSVFSKQYERMDSEGNLIQRDKPFTSMDLKALNRNGTELVKKLFGFKAFSYPKPIDVPAFLLSTTPLDEGDIVLDFFSGSGTTAHALMEDGRQGIRSILVQLPEVLEEKQEAAKHGFATICDIGEERIRRAGDKIKTELEESNRLLKLGEEPNQLPDIGFRVFKLDDSGIRRPGPGELFVDCVKPDRSNLDIVFEMMLKWGLELTLPIEQEKVAGYPCYFVAYGELVCCLAPGLTIDALEAIAEIEPRRVFVLDSILDDSLKLNAVQIFKRVEERTGREVELRTV